MHGSTQSWRTMGCWAGQDLHKLTVSLLNRHTFETEYYQISIPAEFLDSSRGRVIDPEYRVPAPPEDQRQCSVIEHAVASCLRSGPASPDYCIPMFNDDRKRLQSGN